VAANVSVVMDAIGAALGAVDGLNVFDFPPRSAVPPFAFVNLPEEISYDATMARGVDSFTLEVYVAVGNQLDRNSRDTLGAYAAGDENGLKAVIEGALMVDQAIRVSTATFSTITMAGGEYPGLVFTVNVTA
jgi:hypothetical protein